MFITVRSVHVEKIPISVIGGAAAKIRFVGTPGGQSDQKPEACAVRQTGHGRTCVHWRIVLEYLPRNGQCLEEMRDDSHSEGGHGE